MKRSVLFLAFLISFCLFSCAKREQQFYTAGESETEPVQASETITETEETEEKHIHKRVEWLIRSMPSGNTPGVADAICSCGEVLETMEFTSSDKCILAEKMLFDFNSEGGKPYSVKGVDISHYQGNVDWKALENDGIYFAFIKATEGNKITDSAFSRNFTAAMDTNIRIGAYHYFSFKASGRSQAEHFCSVVPKASGMLPPVVDVEYSGSFSDPSVTEESVRNELNDYISVIKSFYGKAPIIYVSDISYQNIIKGYFDECPIWYGNADISIPVGIDWDFWQYSNTHLLNGHNPYKTHIDMDIFRGDEKEFLSYFS